MRIYGRLAVVGLATLGVVSFWFWPTNSPRSRLIAAETSPKFVNVLEMPFKWEGVASCSSDRCHGGSNPRNTLHGEYTYWLKGIPRLGERRGHAFAHQLLRNDLSRQMADHLGIEDPTKADICLNCHASNPKKELYGSKFSTAEGVGCETCHGPAEKWLAIHDQRDWAARSDAEKLSLGFINTKDLLTRANTCMGCHVGSSVDQDVYHDLIAAGHPRLNFEFSTYHSNMERHWRLELDQRRYPDLASHGWLVGQLASAKAAIDLLAHRARQNRVWPEFAEYDCFACHHDLSDPSWRQQRGYPNRKPGSLPWGSWYASIPIALTKLLDGDNAANAHQKLRQLDTLMQSPYPDPAKVSQLALETSAALQAVADEYNRKTLTKDQVAAIYKGLADQGLDMAANSWDSATQTCLSFFALQDGLFELGGGDESIDPLLESFFDAIAMPRGFNSPKNFQPQLIRSEVEKIQQKVSK